MQRVTLTLDDELLAAIDSFIEARGYASRSEAFRDLTRAGLQNVGEEADDAAECVGALIYVFDHGTRELARRLNDTHHDHHDLSVATTHVHLDHDTCFEVAILRGRTADVRHIAAHVMAERGVRHGRLVLVPVAVEREDHAHGTAPHPHDHVRVREAG